MKIRYIGSFPPPYGGVSIKNELLYSELSNYFNIIAFGLSCNKKKLGQIVDLFCACFSRKKLVIGISASRGKSMIITKLLYLFNRKTMRKSVYFMMGGTEPYRIVKSKRQIKQYQTYAKVYVETKTMLDELEKAGLNNVSFFPNCRKRAQFSTINENIDNDLKCLFFSKISKKKGVDNILNVAKSFRDVTFVFYGDIDIDYKENFLSDCNELSNAKYKGIYRGTCDEVYDLFRQYDILLLPTKYDNEGVPGVLIEGKMAGLAEVVTDVCYNSEIVEDGVSGILLKGEIDDNLATAIRMLYNDREMLNKIKKESKLSSELYCIDNYLNDIVSVLQKEEK